MTSKAGTNLSYMDAELKKRHVYPSLQAVGSGSSHRRYNSEISNSGDLNESGNPSPNRETSCLASKVLRLKQSYSTISTHISVDLIQEEEHVEQLQNFLAKLKQVVANTQAALGITVYKHPPMSNRANHSLNLSQNNKSASPEIIRPRLWSGSGTASRGNSQDSTPPVAQKATTNKGLFGRGKPQHMSSPRIYGPEAARLSGERTLPKMKVIEKDYIVVDETDRMEIQNQDHKFGTGVIPISPILSTWNHQPFSRGNSKIHHKRNRSELSDVLQQSRSVIRRTFDDGLRTSSTRAAGIGQAATARALSKMIPHSSTSRAKGDKGILSAQLGSFKHSQPILDLERSKHRRTKTRPDENVEADIDQNYVLVRADGAQIPEKLSQNHWTKFLTSNSRGNVNGHKATQMNKSAWKTQIEILEPIQQAIKKKELCAKDSQENGPPKQHISRPERSGATMKQAADQPKPQKQITTSGKVTSSQSKQTTSLQKPAKDQQADPTKANKLDKIFSVGLLASSGKNLNLSSIKYSHASATDQGGSSAKNWLKLYKTPSVLQSQLKSSMQDLHGPGGTTYRADSMQQHIMTESPLQTLTSKQGSLESLEEVNNFASIGDNQHQTPAEWDAGPEHQQQQDRGNSISKLPASSGIFPLTLGALGTLPTALEMIPEVSKDVSQPTNTLGRDSPTRSRGNTLSGASGKQKHPPPTARLLLK